MEDRWLRELGELARQDDEADRVRFDERWDRLAAGALTAEEEAELVALAASSPEGAEAHEAFRPLGADFQARMVAKARAELAGAPQDDPVEPPNPVLPFRRVVRRVEVWLGGAAAVAASLLFLLRVPALPPLPGYEFASLVVPSEYRGAESHTAAPGSLVELSVRPLTAVRGEVKAQAFLACTGGKLHPWQPPPSPDNTSKGFITLRGRLEMGLQPGDCEIWIVVARPGKLPKDLPAELHAGRTGTADWQAVSAKLKVKLPP